MLPIEVAAGDFVIVGTLVVLEGLLSADNALVLALLVKHLPARQQRKALLYGLIGAFILRGVAIFFARFLMGMWWLCGIGAIYLIGLAGRHFVQHSRTNAETMIAKPVGLSFWATVIQVEFTDIIFAIDSILVAVALVNDPNRMWVVYTGGFIGITLLRLAASFVLRLIAKYPALDHMAYALVGWAGLKLASSSADIHAEALNRIKPHYLPTWAFWGGFALILVVGSLYAVRQGRQVADAETTDKVNDALDRLEGGGFVVENSHSSDPSASRKK